MHTCVHTLPAKFPHLLTRENVLGRQRAVLSKLLRWQQPDTGVSVGGQNTSVISKLLGKSEQKSLDFTLH